MSMNIKIYKENITKIISVESELVVQSDEQLETGTVLLKKLNDIVKAIDDEKSKVLDPLNAAIKAERARWKPIESMYEVALASIRNKISKYQTQKMNNAKKEEEAIANRIGEGKGKIKIETAAKKFTEIDRPDKKIGNVSFREDKVLKIIDISKIPREYMVVDEKAVRNALKEGKEVAGAILETVLTPVTR